VDLITADTVSPTLSFRLIRTALGYHALDQILAHAYNHMNHDAAELDLANFSCEAISR